MKKVVNINLGGKPFTIDHDAYDELDSYLHSIKKRFSNSSGMEDILYDIESRLAELFEENEHGSTIITMKKVQTVKSIMGTPNDFDSDENITYADNESYSSTQKRLFRDPDDKVIAGVASGLSAYLGIKSSNLVRAMFLLAFFMGGIGFLPYLALWVFVPEARTASDRLAMYGEKINIDTIANSVEESLTDIKDTLEDIHNKVKSKMS